MALFEAGRKDHFSDRVVDLYLAVAYDKAGDAALAGETYDRACRTIDKTGEQTFQDVNDARTEADAHFRSGKPD